MIGNVIFNKSTSIRIYVTCIWIYALETR